MMCKLAGTTLGSIDQILKTAYQGTVIPFMEYSSTTWSTTPKTNQHPLDKAQNQALRIITGVPSLFPLLHGKVDWNPAIALTETSQNTTPSTEAQVSPRPPNEFQVKWVHKESAMA